MRLNSHKTESWVKQKPYTAMLHGYQAAADRLLVRQAQLRDELHSMQMHKRGTLASAQAQKLLEQRIAMLRAEYVEMTDVMREISLYAEQEVH